MKHRGAATGGVALLLLLCLSGSTYGENEPAYWMEISGLVHADYETRLLVESPIQTTHRIDAADHRGLCARVGRYLNRAKTTGVFLEGMMLRSTRWSWTLLHYNADDARNPFDDQYTVSADMDTYYHHLLLGLSGKKLLTPARFSPSLSVEASAAGGFAMGEGEVSLYTSLQSDPPVWGGGVQTHSGTQFASKFQIGLGIQHAAYFAKAGFYLLGAEIVRDTLTYTSEGYFVTVGADL